MKKLLIVLSVICIALSFSACSTDSAAPKKASTSDTTENTSLKNAEDKSFGLNETAEFKNLKVTAIKIEESKGKDFFEADDGKVFIGVNFEIENISDEEQSISSLLLFDAYSDDIKCEYSLSANVVFGEGTLDGKLSPGKKLVGWYAVEAPQNWQKLELEVKSSWLSNSKAKFVFNK